jgi:hypothetical protein
MGLLHTTLPLFSSLVRLHHLRVKEKLEMEHLRLYISYSIMRGTGGHLFNKPPSLEQFEAWYELWSRSHLPSAHLGGKEGAGVEEGTLGRRTTSAAGRTMGLIHLDVQEEAEEEKTGRRIGREEFDEWFRMTFEKDVEFGKSGLIFEYVVNPVDKKMVHMNDIQPQRYILSFLSDSKDIPPIFPRYGPFNQMKYTSPSSLPSLIVLFFFWMIIIMTTHPSLSLLASLFLIILHKFSQKRQF